MTSTTFERDEEAVMEDVDLESIIDSISTYQKDENIERSIKMIEAKIKEINTSQTQDFQVAAFKEEFEELKKIVMEMYQRKTNQEQNLNKIK